MGRLHQIGFVVLVSAVVATSTFAANPDQGETLVKRWCAGCHLVAADQKERLQRLIDVLIGWMKQYEFEPAAVELRFGLDC